MADADVSCTDAADVYRFHIWRARSRLLRANKDKSHLRGIYSFLHKEASIIFQDKRKSKACLGRAGWGGVGGGAH